MSPWRVFAAPIYKNTGSVARDHLASERTFLAWTRTGVGFVALGIAVERFSQFDALNPQHALDKDDDRRKEDERNSQILVGTLMSLGSGCIVYATGRYFSGLKALERGEFRPAYRGVAVLGVAMAFLAGGAFVGSMRTYRYQRRIREAS
jgi:uncharacterized membrane protein YidH (DUF202 family)